MKLGLVVTVISECSVMSDLEEHLEGEVAPVQASPKNLSCPSQDMEYVPEILRGNAFCEESSQAFF